MSGTKAVKPKLVPWLTADLVAQGLLEIVGRIESAGMKMPITIEDLRNYAAMLQQISLDLRREGAKPEPYEPNGKAP